MSYPFQPLESLGTIQTGSTPATTEDSYWGGDIPFVTPGELDQDSPVTKTPRTLSARGAEQARLLNAHAVMVCCIGSLGKVGIAGRQLVTNQQINAIEFHEDKIFPRFGYYACQRLKQKMFSVAPATTVAIVNKSKFGRLEIPVPPVPEQRRIAAILDHAATLRAKRRAALAWLDSLVQSVFRETFRSSLASEKRIPLKEFVTEFRYGTSNKSESSGYPALRIPNVAGGTLDLGELKTVPVDDAEFSRLKLIDGDLLFVRTNGNPDFVGRCAVFDSTLVATTGFETSSFIYASYLIRARLNTKQLLPAVLQQYLSFDEGKRGVRSKSKTSAGQFNINTEGLGALRIPMLPMRDQLAFLEQLKKIERQRSIQRRFLDESDALMGSLEYRAFRGEL